MHTHLDQLTHSRLSLHGLRDALAHLIVGQDDHAHEFLRRLVTLNGALGAGKAASVDELAYSVLGVCIARVPSYGQGASSRMRGPGGGG